MLPTPSTSHVSYDTIYEPAEDSYLFLDTLSSPSETTWLHAHFATTSDTNVTRYSSPAPFLVELGPGSGVIIAFLTTHARKVFGRDILSLAIDVNTHACQATRITVEKAIAADDQHGSHGNSNSIYISSVSGDLASPLRPSEVDILIFNPPYVPTDSVPAFPSTSGTGGKVSFEESSHLLSLSYAGGADGMEVTNRLLAQIPEILSNRGVAYILFCRGNKPEEVKAWIASWEGTEEWKWCAETVGTSGKTAGWEKLEIVRIWRQRDHDP
ncbi:S-adenosylmethionine-dependent methyltransferase [Rhinocladiella similis]